MNEVTKVRYGASKQHEIEMVVCSCGARHKGKNGLKRFLDRHPRLCSERSSERREFAKQLAAGTRSVDDSANWKQEDEDNAI